MTFFDNVLGSDPQPTEPLTMDDLRDAIDTIRKAEQSRPRPGLGIPPARTLSDAMFREVGLLEDREVARLAYQGLWAAWAGQPMHPRQACALRVAFARSGSVGAETVANGTLAEWVTALVVPTDDEAPGMTLQELLGDIDTLIGPDDGV